MSAYIIVGLTPKDADKIQEYGSQVPATLARYSGKVLAKGPVVQFHGSFDYDVQVIISFPTREDANNWYHSDDYQKLIPNRNQAMDSQFQLVG